MLARERRQVATQRQAESLKAAHLGCEVLGAPRVAPHHQERGAPAHVARHLLCGCGYVVRGVGAVGLGRGVVQGQRQCGGVEAVGWGRGSAQGQGQRAGAGAVWWGRGSVVGQGRCVGAGAVSGAANALLDPSLCSTTTSPQRLWREQPVAGTPHLAAWSLSLSCAMPGLAKLTHTHGTLGFPSKKGKECPPCRRGASRSPPPPRASLSPARPTPQTSCLQAEGCMGRGSKVCMGWVQLGVEPRAGGRCFLESSTFAPQPLRTHAKQVALEAAIASTHAQPDHSSSKTAPKRPLPAINERCAHHHSPVRQSGWPRGAGCAGSGQWQGGQTELGRASMGTTQNQQAHT